MVSVRSSASESVSGPGTGSEPVLQAVAILKPRTGGPAFWRMLMCLLRDDVREFKVLALQLHSKAWLYIVPLDVLADLEVVWIPSGLGVITAKEVNIKQYCRRFKCKEITVRRLKREVKRWWGISEYEYLEVIDEGRRLEVYKGPKPREVTDSESVDLRTLDSESIATDSNSAGIDSTDSDSELLADSDSKELSPSCLSSRHGGGR